MGSTTAPPGLRRTAGGLLVVGAVGFAVAATVLSSTFDWPDILREPGSVVLPAFVAGGESLVWTWFATAWTYAILAVPILLLPAVLGRRDDPALRVATVVGAASVLLSLIGFLRWVFVVTAAGRVLCRRRCRHPGRRGRRLDGPAPVRRRAAGRAPRTADGHRLVGHPERGHPAVRGTAAVARDHRSRRQCRLPAQPGRHPGDRRTRLPGLGPRRAARQYRLGTWVAAVGVTVLLRPVGAARASTPAPDTITAPGTPGAAPPAVAGLRS